MRYVGIFAAALVLASCSGKPEQEEITTTNGPLVIIASDELAPVIDTVAKEFARIYPGIRPVVTAAPTREAIAHLLNDSVRTIVVDRPFNDEERRVIRESELNVVGTPVALDALVLVVNADHALTGVTQNDMRAIVSGAAQRWSQVKGSSRSDAIEFVCTDRNSGLQEQIVRVIAGGSPLKVFAAGTGQKELVQYVGRSPRAAAVVSLAALRDRPASVRVVAVEALPDTAKGNKEFVVPTQTSVYEGRYPYRTEVLVYNAERRLGPGAGFPAFALTTPGQKIVQNSGLVPAVIPNRVIQLTTE